MKRALYCSLVILWLHETAYCHVIHRREIEDVQTNITTFSTSELPFKKLLTATTSKPITSATQKSNRHDEATLVEATAKSNEAVQNVAVPVGKEKTQKDASINEYDEELGRDDNEADASGTKEPIVVSTTEFHFDIDKYMGDFKTNGNETGFMSSPNSSTSDAQSVHPFADGNNKRFFEEINISTPSTKLMLEESASATAPVPFNTDDNDVIFDDDEPRQFLHNDERTVQPSVISTTTTTTATLINLDDIRTNTTSERNTSSLVVLNELENVNYEINTNEIRNASVNNNNNNIVDNKNQTVTVGTAEKRGKYLQDPNDDIPNTSAAWSLVKMTHNSGHGYNIDTVTNDNETAKILTNWSKMNKSNELFNNSYTSDGQPIITAAEQSPVTLHQKHSDEKEVSAAVIDAPADQNIEENQMISILVTALPPVHVNASSQDAVTHSITDNQIDVQQQRRVPTVEQHAEKNKIDELAEFDFVATQPRNKSSKIIDSSLDAGNSAISSVRELDRNTLPTDDGIDSKDGNIFNAVKQNSTIPQIKVTRPDSPKLVENTATTTENSQTTTMQSMDATEAITFNDQSETTTIVIENSTDGLNDDNRMDSTILPIKELVETTTSAEVIANTTQLATTEIAQTTTAQQTLTMTTKQSTTTEKVTTNKPETTRYEPMITTTTAFVVNPPNPTDATPDTSIESNSVENSTQSIKDLNKSNIEITTTLSELSKNSVQSTASTEEEEVVDSTSSSTTSSSTTPVTTTIMESSSTQMPTTTTQLSTTQIVAETTTIKATTAALLPPQKKPFSKSEQQVDRLTSTSDAPITTPTSTTMRPIHADSKDETTSDGGDINGTIAIVVSIVGVVALVLLVGFLFVMRKRQKQMSYGQRCRPVSLDAYSLDNISVYNSVRRKGVLRTSKRTYGNMAFDDPALKNHLLTIQTLGEFVKNKNGIYEEFKDLPQVLARVDEVPVGCEDKNRYANVVPLPETRVILNNINGDEKTEYINGNYVKGPKDTGNYYIACQAPLENTITDFWRMIWEQNSRVIIMATDLSENGVEKCAEYLPQSLVLDNHVIYGDYQVIMKNREVKEKYAVTQVHLKNVTTKTWREITHIWYQWPDAGVPTDETSVIAMLLEARSYLKMAMPDQSEDAEQETGLSSEIVSTNGSMDKVKSLPRAIQGPLTVHCSPGTGRTGSIIACDIAIRALEQPTRSVDVPQIVYYVRRGRASSVRTRDQYEFIYRVAHIYATKLTGSVAEQ